jgi:hypothetical protein
MELEFGVLTLCRGLGFAFTGHDQLIQRNADGVEGDPATPGAFRSRAKCETHAGVASCFASAAAGANLETDAAIASAGAMMPSVSPQASGRPVFVAGERDNVSIVRRSVLATSLLSPLA